MIKQMINKIKSIWSKQKYSSFIIRILAFCFLIILCDFFIGKTLALFFKKQTSGWEYSTKYAIEEVQTDLLILGASRAQEQYMPSILEDSLQISSYNIGKSGMSFFYHYAIFKSVLKRYSPKIIVFDFETNEFLKNESSYATLSTILPYYKSQPELRPIINLRSPFEKYKLLSATYPYNSLIFKIAIGNTNLNNKVKKEDKGYVALTRKLNQPMHNVDLSIPYEIDTLKINLFNKLIDECKEKDIQLFIVCAPYYINHLGKDTSVELVKEIAYRKNITFLDYAQNETFMKKPLLFDDTVHLNKTGATIFSAMLGSKLKALVSTK